MRHFKIIVCKKVMTLRIKLLCSWVFLAAIQQVISWIIWAVVALCCLADYWNNILWCTCECRLFLVKAQSVVADWSLRNFLYILCLLSWVDCVENYMPYRGTLQEGFETVLKYPYSLLRNADPQTPNNSSLLWLRTFPRWWK